MKRKKEKIGLIWQTPYANRRNIRSHNDYGSTWDGQLGSDSHQIGVVKSAYGIETFPFTIK